ncbi:FimV/HubP family polar landmark protein [Aliiglaciecola aliphaticivorans]
MNVRQVAFLLFASVGLWSISATVDAQQLQIRGPKSNTAEFSGTTYGPVVPEDTLWRIASRYRQNKNLSVYQVMQAIYQLNPDAFEDQNFNHLVDGSILKLPSERYVARIDPKAAQMKAEQDDSAWRAFTKGETQQVNVKTSQEAASKDDLTETKQVIEEKLSALDAEQNRQFTAIRQQFAESIESVQTLLNENRKLVDRLDAVDTEIGSLRGRVDEELQVQMDQMLALQNELLAISREAENQRKAEMQSSGFAWLTDPLFLILLSVLFTISLLGAFAMWLIRRKRPETESGPILDENHAAILEQSDEMDDLADALTNELSEELEDSDDDLFGEDDLLDDVLSEELEESLDETGEDSFEAFDDLDDDSLDPVIEESKDEIAEGDSVLEDDLDNLFDEEDLLADIGDELTEGESDAKADSTAEQDSEQGAEEDELDLAESNQDDTADDEIDGLGELPDLDSDTPEDKVEQSESTVEDSAKATESSTPEIKPPVIDDEPDKPEISIDELLEQPQTEQEVDSIVSDNSDLMNEEMLQNIDKEIHQQNAQLDNITDELLNEIEQLEQMGGMLDEEPETLEEPTPAESQMGIQELDSLTENLDEEDLVEDVIDDDSEELDIADELFDAIEEDEVEQDVIEQDVDESVNPSEDPQDLDNGAETPLDDSQVEDETLSQDVDEPVNPSEDVQAPENGADTPLDESQLEDEVLNQDVKAAVNPSEDVQAPENGAETPLDESQVEDEVLSQDVDEPVNPSEDAQAPENGADTPLDESQVEDEVLSQDVDDIDDLLNQENVEDNSVESLSADELLAEFENDKSEKIDELTESGSALPPEPEDVQSELADVLNEAEEPLEIEETQGVQDPTEEQNLVDSPETVDEQETAVDLTTEQNSENKVEQIQSDEIEDLDKALDEFEQEVVSEATSFDVEIGDDNFTPSEDSDDMQLEQIIPIDKEDDIEKVLSDFDEEIPSIDDIDSLSGEGSDGFDDADLDEALKAFDEDYLAEQDNLVEKQSTDKSENVELDDLPGLGDWLSSEEAEESNSLNELEKTSFDELLDSIDTTEDNPKDLPSIDDENTLSNVDSGLDFDALLNDADMTASPQQTPSDQQSEDDFLDVDDLINESIEAEGTQEIDKELNLAAAFESYAGFGEADEVDVDGDNGIGAKLDLAQAYLETDDIDAAKELLEEVISKGDESQRLEAQELLTKLAE